MKLRFPLPDMFIFSDFGSVYKELSAPLRREGIRLFGYMFVLACFEVLSVLSLSFLAMSVAAPQAILGHPLVQSLLAHIPLLQSISTDTRYFVLSASLSVVVLFVVKNSLSALVGVRTAVFGEHVAYYAGKKLYAYFLHSPYIWHLSPESRVCMGTIAFKEQLGVFIISIMNVYTYAFISIAMFLLLVSATPLILLLAIGFTLVLSVAIYKCIKRKLDSSSATLAQLMTDEQRMSTDALNGVREILIYNRQKVFFESWASTSQQSLPCQSFLGIAPSIPSWILECVGFLAIPLTVGILISVENASMEQMAGILTMIMLSCWRILPMVNRSLACLITVRAVRAMAMNCLAQLRQIPPQAPFMSLEPASGFSLKKTLTFSHVSFRYPNANVDALHDFSFELHKGMRLGVIGTSGSGKSTFAALLCALLEPTEGEVRIDGIKPSPEQTLAYRLRLGYVPQTPYVLPGTLAANVAFSQWGSPVNEEKALQACRMAALDMVEKNPAMLWAPVGERGGGFSGGQVQRISIARALYADPEILILDEATSSLDSASEQDIMHTVNSLPNQLSIVIIAHRLTTVAKCDHILWIENGRLVSHGPPEEILPLYEAAMRDCSGKRDGICA